MKHAIVWPAVILSFVGCSSARIHYYTLSAPQHLTAEKPSMSLPVDVTTMRMPRQVDRRQLIVRAGDNEMQILENEEWASAIGNELSSALLFEISSQLAQADPRLVGNIKALSLKLDVTRLETVMDRYDTLSITWRMKLTAQEASFNQSCPFGVLIPIQQGISGMVAGYQQAIAALARDVVASTVTSGGVSAPLCPISDF